MKSISQLAKEFGVSTRTIRYYEELGLLKPERTISSQRQYYPKDVARMKLITRGKKYGFQLEEIKEMIVLFDKDRSGKAQIVRTMEYGRQKLEDINARIDELKQIKKEMAGLLSDFEKKLNEE